ELPRQAPPGPARGRDRLLERRPPRRLPPGPPGRGHLPARRRARGGGPRSGLPVHRDPPVRARSGAPGHLPEALRHRRGDAPGRGRLAGVARRGDHRRHGRRDPPQRPPRGARGRRHLDPIRRHETRSTMTPRPRNVFVAGATGVIGRPAVRSLLADGHEVTAVARSPEKAADLRAMGARPVTVDLFDATAVKEATAGHTAIVNLATRIPPSSKAWRAGAWAENERLRTEAARTEERRVG